MNNDDIEKIVDEAVSEIRNQLRDVQKSADELRTELAEIQSQLETLKSGM